MVREGRGRGRGTGDSGWESACNDKARHDDHEGVRELHVGVRGIGLDGLLEMGMNGKM